MFPELTCLTPLPKEYADAGLSTIEFCSSMHTIGRSQENSTVIPCAGISRCHCRFACVDSQWTVRDLSSTFVTVNGLRIPKNQDYHLVNRDIIKLDPEGHLTYIFSHEAADAADPPSPLLLASPASPTSPTSTLLDDSETEMIEFTTSNPSPSCSHNKPPKTCADQSMREVYLMRKIKKSETELKQKTDLFNARLQEINQLKENLFYRLECAKEQERQKNHEIEQKYQQDIKSLQEKFDIEIQDLKSTHLREQELKERLIEKYLWHLNLYKSFVVSKKEEIDTLKEKLTEKCDQLANNIKEMTEQQNITKEALKKISEIEESRDKYEKAVKFYEPNNPFDADFHNSLNTELQCSICNEIFIRPIMVKCGHTFCKYCLDMWKKNKKSCPICRAPITGESKNIVLNSLIEFVLPKLNKKISSKRKERERETYPNKKTCS